MNKQDDFDELTRLSMSIFLLLLFIKPETFLLVFTIRRVISILPKNFFYMDDIIKTNKLTGSLYV